MNFFEHQARARKQTRWLVVAMLFSVLMTAGLVVGLLAVGVGENGDPLVLLGVGGAVIGVILIASLARMVWLGRGGGVLARGLGAIQVDAGATQPRLKRLRNVVEEMAIASGVPVPEIFVLEQEAGINAFAAGFSPADAAVCVTAGALDRLSRDELQGVVAHEFSHLLNGDMRLNLRLLGMLFGLLVIGVIGRHLMQVRGRDKEGNVIALVGVGLWLIGSIGLLCARVIKASISRQREYLADASAVQFTRQTDGLAGALKKAAALPQGTKLEVADGEEVAHMLFGDGVGYGALFATHPPLVERLRRLDPRFNAAELAALGAALPTIAQSGEDEPLAAAAMLGFAPKAQTALDPAQVAGMVGQTLDAQLGQARRMRQQFAPVLKMAARSSDQAPALLLALVIDRKPELRQRQLELVAQRVPALATGVNRLLAVLDSEQFEERLPIAQLAFPAIKQRPATELNGLIQVLENLIHLDGRIALFEYCLALLLGTLLADAASASKSGRLGQLQLSQAYEPGVKLLTVLAALGSPANPAAAFAAGMQRIAPAAQARYLQPTDWQLDLDQALPALDQLSPQAKPQLIEAMSAVLVHDGVITVAEAELLRALCACLHCPLPPLFDGE